MWFQASLSKKTLNIGRSKSDWVPTTALAEPERAKGSLVATHPIRCDREQPGQLVNRQQTLGRHCNRQAFSQQFHGALSDPRDLLIRERDNQLDHRCSP